MNATALTPEALDALMAGEAAHAVLDIRERGAYERGHVFRSTSLPRRLLETRMPALVTAQMGQLPQGSSAILVTPMIYPELLVAVDSLLRRNLRPVVALLMTLSFGSRASNDDLAKSLEERKVPVCRVYCDEDLAETLSAFYAKTSSQDSSWRRPVLSHLT